MVVSGTYELVFISKSSHVVYQAVIDHTNKLKII